MMVVLLVAGLGLLLGGLLTVGLGIQLDLSFGNTLILAGAVVACTGAMMLALWTAVREVARHLGPGLPAESRARGAASVAITAPGDRAPQRGALPSGYDEALTEHEGHAEPAPPPWHEETSSRDPGRGEAPAEAAPVAKARRNLLFSSTSRKERERAAQARMVELPATEPQPAAAPPAVEPAEAPPATFEDAWPKPERGRSADASLPRRLGRTPSTFAEAEAQGQAKSQGQAAAVAERPALPGRPEEPAPVTVLKSGVVDGMAYSLYSDGSIEAQMPEGMMRFASIDELRTHLDQRP